MQIAKIHIPQPGHILSVQHRIIDLDHDILRLRIPADQENLLLESHGILGQIQLHTSSVYPVGAFSVIAVVKTPYGLFKSVPGPVRRQKSRIDTEGIVYIIRRLGAGDNSPAVQCKGIGSVLKHHIRHGHVGLRTRQSAFRAVIDPQLPIVDYVVFQAAAAGGTEDALPHSYRHIVSDTLSDAVSKLPIFEAGSQCKGTDIVTVCDQYRLRHSLHGLLNLAAGNIHLAGAVQLVSENIGHQHTVRL